jgi:hypothetical protein
VLDSGARSYTCALTQACTISREMNASTSLRNTAMYSALARAGSASIAASMTRCGTVAFMARVGACQTNTGSPSLPKWRRCIFHNSPLRAYGDDAHSNIAPGMVAMPGRNAASTSVSGSLECSSVGQNASSSSSAAMIV